MKPYGVEIRTINGKEYAIWRNRLQDEMYATLFYGLLKTLRLTTTMSVVSEPSEKRLSI